MHKETLCSHSKENYLYRICKFRNVANVFKPEKVIDDTLAKARYRDATLNHGASVKGDCFERKKIDGNAVDDDAVRSMTKRQLVRRESLESVNTQRWELIHRLPEHKLPSIQGDRVQDCYSQLHGRLDQRVLYICALLNSLCNCNAAIRGNDDCIVHK